MCDIDELEQPLGPRVRVASCCRLSIGMGPCGYVRTSDVALVMIIKDVIEGGVGIAFESRIDVSFTGSLLPALTMSHIRLQCELCSIEGHAGVALRFPFHFPFSLPLPVRSSTALLRPLVTTLTFRTNTGRTQPEREENEWRRCRRLASGPFWDHRILLSLALSLSLTHSLSRSTRLSRRGGYRGREKEEQD